MIKVFFTSSESHNLFGVNQVFRNLKTFLSKRCIVSTSNNFYDFVNTRYDLIHIHGCWRLSIFFYFLLAKILGVKIIISPHGMLDPYSFTQKKIIKLLFWHFLQKYIFKFANQIIVNSSNEKNNILKILYHNNIIVIPHGIKFIKTKIKKKISNKKKLNFVFFSRIHPVKNLDTLIDIWIKDTYFKKFDLNIYGEVSDYVYFNLIKTKVSKFKNIKYHGALNENKIKTLSKHDVFILPSKSENFGLVVLEALAAGLYLILNKKLPWKYTTAKGFGSLIDFKNDNLKNEIKKINKKKNKFRNSNYMNKVHSYLYKNYNWETISNLYFINYKKLLK
jgi:glycosyltransferase involved in cell wall biosynthesis